MQTMVAMATFESRQVSNVRIRQERAASEALVAQFIRVAAVCLDNVGDCSFEWPRFCTGWALPLIQSWILERNLHSATFNGCAVGVEADGQPAKKPWRFITSSYCVWPRIFLH